MSAATSPTGPDAGLFVAFEGGEGCGKSTQLPLLAATLRAAGHDVVTTFEPGEGQVGAGIRAILLDPATLDLAPRAEALLYAADRAQHVAAVVAPALTAGRVVLTDRYLDSSLAYQGAGRDLPLVEIAELSAWGTAGLLPDLTVLLDLPVADGLARARGRAELDRLEGESLAFHGRVRAGFRALAAAEPDRYLVLEAARSREALAGEIADRVQSLLSARVPSGGAR